MTKMDWDRPKPAKSEKAVAYVPDMKRYQPVLDFLDAYSGDFEFLVKMKAMRRAAPFTWLPTPKQLAAIERCMDSYHVKLTDQSVRPSRG